MRVQNMPLVNGRYWIAITAASIFGANLGDFGSRIVGLGHVRGLPVLALILAAIMLTEQRSWFKTEGFYWAAIITLRTAATNISDLATHDLKLSYAGFIILLIFAVSVLVAVTTRRSAQPLKETGTPYWATMLLAGILGTALGDDWADELGLGVSICFWLVAWATILTIVARRPCLQPTLYWTAIVVVRTLGTNMGDYLVGRHGFGLGLPVGTALSGLVFVALLVAWPRGEPIANRLVR